MSMSVGLAAAALIAAVSPLHNQGLDCMLFFQLLDSLAPGFLLDMRLAHLCNCTPY